MHKSITLDENWKSELLPHNPSANNAELVGQLEHAITDHEYPPRVWAARTTPRAIQSRTRAHPQLRPALLLRAHYRQ